MSKERYNQYITDIEKLQKMLTPGQTKLLKIELWLRVIKRLEQYYSYCEGCQRYFDQVEDMINTLKSKTVLSKDNLRKHNIDLKTMVAHLQRKHKLVVESQYMLHYLTLGLTLGAGLGVALNNIALGPGIGICLGICVGSLLDYKAQKEGRVI